GLLYMFDVPRFHQASRSSTQNGHSFAPFSTKGTIGLPNSMLFGLPVDLHLLCMLLEADGEAGVTCGITDEVQVVGLRGVHCRAQRRQAGTADGSRRQARVQI